MATPRSKAFIYLDLPLLGGGKGEGVRNGVYGKGSRVRQKGDRALALKNS